VQVMEEIWVDLSNPQSGFTPPGWHRQILEERKKGIQNGTQRFTDWDPAYNPAKSPLVSPGTLPGVS
jgi:hypothetical protein